MRAKPSVIPLPAPQIVPLRIQLLLLLTVLLMIWTMNSSYALTCAEQPFTPPADDAEHLASGQWGEWNQSFTQRLITVEDVDHQPWNYYTLEKKPADADRLVLFLHGFPEFSWAWEKQLETFGERYHAVAIDLKGFHYSSTPDDIWEYDFQSISYEIRALIRCLGYETATIVGHDFGAGLGWVMGMLHPDMIDGLVLMSVPHPWVFARELMDPDSEQADLVEYMTFARGTSVLDNARFWNFLFKDTSILETDFYTGKRLFRLMGEAWSPLERWTTMKHYYRAMDFFPPLEQDFPAELTRFQQQIYSVKRPVLAIWGEADPYFTDAVKQYDMSALVSDYELTIVPGATHWVNHEDVQLNDRIQAFLVRTNAAE